MIERSKLIIFLILVLSLQAFSIKIESPVQREQVQISYQQTQGDQLYRPLFHFSPSKNWINDPNGMFYLNGTFNLYFQYFPNGTNWGPMHWGHATSVDLVSWKEQPIALYPDSLGYIFSGSAVVDLNNTSGFGTRENPPVVAIFTHHDPNKQKQGRIDIESQSIAYSLDKGMTFTKFEYNPVIANPGIRDFRDPNVNWYPQFQKWILVLAAGNRVKFYSSNNLKDWEYLSDFGAQYGNHGGVWECPDFSYLQVHQIQQETDLHKWLLIVSIGSGGPNGGSATQYFIGDFDGKYFKLDAEFQKDLKKNNDYWVNFGRDSYAGGNLKNIQTSTQNSFNLYISWMSNWQYANQVPTVSYRNSMTFPTLMLIIYVNSTRESYRLGYVMLSLYGFLADKVYLSNLTIDNRQQQSLISKGRLELTSFQFRFGIDSAPTKGRLEFKLSNQKTQQFVLFGFDADKDQYFVDRRSSGNVEFNQNFANPIIKAPRHQIMQNFEGYMLFDRSSMQFFFDAIQCGDIQQTCFGFTYMTELVFPNQAYDTLSVVTTQQKITVEYIHVMSLRKNKQDRDIANQQVIGLLEKPK